MLGGTSAAMVDAAAISAATKAAVVALLRHRRRHGAAQHRDIGRGRAGHPGEEHAEHGDDLRQAAADVADQRLRQIGDADAPRWPRSSARRPAGRTASPCSASESMPLNSWPMIEGRLTGGEQRADHHAGDQRERHRHAEIAEDQEQHRHQPRIRPLARSCRRRPAVPLVAAFVGIGGLEAVAPAVDELLDREQRDQRAARAGSRHTARRSASSTACGSCRSPAGN